MKKKISFILIGSVILATPCFALFEDVGYLIQIINQGRQTIQLAQQAKANFEQAAAFVKNPGSCRNVLYRAQSTLNQASTGSDNVALQRMNESLKASQEVYTAISSEVPTTANMAALSALSLQQVEMKQKADELNTHLRFMADVEQRMRQAQPISSNGLGRLMK
jgi:K+ transporter